MNKIAPLIEYGHTNFGENKVQEALAKWSEIKNTNDKIKLHLLGKLQSNKVKYVIPLFDYIHTLDSLKLAKKISQEQEKKNFRPNVPISDVGCAMKSPFTCDHLGLGPSSRRRCLHNFFA